MSTDTENTTESTTTTTTSWLSTWLTTLGMSQTWANIIATAIIAAAGAIYAMTTTSCELASVTSDPTTTTIVGTDGSTAVITATSEDEWSFIWTQAQDTAESEGEEYETATVIEVSGEK